MVSRSVVLENLNLASQRNSTSNANISPQQTVKPNLIQSQTKDSPYLPKLETPRPIEIPKTIESPKPTQPPNPPLGRYPASLQPTKPPRSPSPHPILNDAFEDIDYNEEESEEEDEDDEDSIEVNDPDGDIRFVKQQAKYPVDDFLNRERNQHIRENTSRYDRKLKLIWVLF